MPSTMRRVLAFVALVVASAALLATSPAQYSADISDEVAQEIELTGERPIGTTTIRLLVSLRAVEGLSESAMTSITVTATAPEGGDPELVPEFRVSGVAGAETALGDASNPDSIEFNLGRLCLMGEDCDRPLDLTVEWLNAVPGATQPARLLVEAGIDFALEEGEAPIGASIALEIDDELALAEPTPTLRTRTAPETVTLSADAPYALRHVLVEIEADALPTTGDAERDQTAIFAITGLEQAAAVAEVWVEDEFGQALGGVAPGSVMPLRCEPGARCVRGYTLVLAWNSNDPEAIAEVTWELSSVLRYDDRAEPPPEGAMTATVDRVVDTTGDERERIEVEIGGTIERDPGDPPIEIPFEPSREGPNTFTLDLATWQPVAGAGALGIPATGVMTLVARSADGSPLSGPVQVSVTTWYEVVVNGPPRNEELTQEAPEHSFAILPTRSCQDPDQGEFGRPDGRCTVPFDVYVQTPAEATGPVIVEWTVRVQAVEADGLTLGAGDLRWVRGR